MKNIFIILLALLSLASCGREGDTVPSGNEVSGLERPSNPDAAFSYVYGYMLAKSALEYTDAIDYGYMARGVLDFQSGESFFSGSEMRDIVSRYQANAAEEAQERFMRASMRNLGDAEEFLEANGRRAGVRTTDSGLQYEVLERGDGRSASPDSTVIVHYILTLIDGTRADSSYERGEAAEIELPSAIPGFREAVSMMREGDRYRFWIPPDLGYGQLAVSGISPNSLLIFDIELIEVVE